MKRKLLRQLAAALAASAAALTAAGCGCGDDDLSRGVPDPVDPCVSGEIECFDADGNPVPIALDVVDEDRSTWDSDPVEFVPSQVEGEPQGVEFGRVNTGEKRVVQIPFANAKGLRAKLEVDQTASGIDGGDGAYTIKAWPELPLAPGETGYVTVQFLPPDGGELTPIPYEATLSIKAKDAGDAAIQYTLTGGGVRPQATFRGAPSAEETIAAGGSAEWPVIATAEHDIGQVALTSPRDVPIRIENTGQGILTLYAARFEGEQAQFFTVIGDFAQPVTLARGDDFANDVNRRYDLNIRCEPQAEAEYRATLIVRHNDINGANIDSASPAVLSDGSVESRLDIVCHGAPAGCPTPEIDVLEVDRGRFQRVGVKECASDDDCDDGLPCVENVGCDAGEACSPAKFCDDGEPPRYNVSAPVHVELSAKRTHDPEGVPAEDLDYRWFFDSQDAPDGSYAGLDDTPGQHESRNMATTFFADLVGVYTVYVEVTDNNGESCGPYPVTLEAKPSQKVHIELLWSAPRVDLDLHLVNTDTVEPDTGVIWSTPCDAYWKNRNPDWGTPRADSSALYCRNWEEKDDLTLKDECGDDPSLDIDATHQLRQCADSEKSRIDAYVNQYPDLAPLCEDSSSRDCESFLETLLEHKRTEQGLAPDDDSQDEDLVKAKDQEFIRGLCKVDTGPENINIVDPEAATYRVYVQYFEGVFSTDARVRIFLNGDKVDSATGPNGDFAPPEGTKLKPGDLWDVAFIDWPGSDLPSDFDAQDHFRETGAISPNAKPPAGGDPECTLNGF